MVHRRVFVLRLLITCFFLTPLLACPNHSSSKQEPAQTVPPPPARISPPVNAAPLPQKPEIAPPPSTEVQPIAIIKSGDNPLWFELGPENGDSAGPYLIIAPEEASLTPFEPWPQARLVTGMMFHDEELIMGINREGFLCALPWKDEGIALYRITDAGYWNNYTIGSLFLFEGNPAALLYRNDFFADPLSIPPSPRVFIQSKGNSYPVGITIPAFEDFPSSAGWDVESLREGPDGYWYYRGVQRSTALSQYRRTSDLSFSGETVSVSAFRNSAFPLSPDKAPPLLRLVLDRVFSLNRGKGIAAVISPSFSYTRYFSANTAFTEEGESLAELTGYYRNSDGGAAQALVILPDGRGIFGKVQGEDFKFEALTLPPLPEGFVYTRIGSSGNTIFAAWEEQQDVTVGAAGLMVLRSPIP